MITLPNIDDIYIIIKEVPIMGKNMNSTMWKNASIRRVMEPTIPAGRRYEWAYSYNENIYNIPIGIKIKLVKFIIRQGRSYQYKYSDFHFNFDKKQELKGGFNINESVWDKIELLESNIITQEPQPTQESIRNNISDDDIINMM